MPGNTIPVKWLQDKNGDHFYPVTHKGAVRDDNGNPIAIPEVLDDLNDVIITPVIDNTQTYFENAVQDYDGNWYDAVIIGDQVWMAENLRTTHYADGTALSSGYYYPNGAEANIDQYGLLYNWAAVMNGESSSNTNPSGIQGLAPTGWHIPSQSEFSQLVTYMNSNSGYAPFFKNQLAGYLLSSDGYYNFNSYAYYRCSTEHSSPTYAYLYYIASNSSAFSSTEQKKDRGCSVRCLYNGTVSQFRESMAPRNLQGQILKHDGSHWVNTEISHDFTFGGETVSTSSATVTFGASQRGAHFISTGNDLSITFSVNNESDNYLWIYNTGNSAIQIYIYDMFHNGSQVKNIYMPEDDIIIQPGYAGEISIVCNKAGAFITIRCDLKYMVNGGITT